MTKENKEGIVELFGGATIMLAPMIAIIGMPLGLSTWANESDSAATVNHDRVTAALVEELNPTKQELVEFNYEPISAKCVPLHDQDIVAQVSVDGSGSYCLHRSISPREEQPLFMESGLIYTINSIEKLQGDYQNDKL